MSPWRSFLVDYARYPRRAWLTQPAILAIAVYRFGTWTKVAPPVIRPIVHAAYFGAYSVVRLATGIDIPRSVRIGPGLMIHHYGGVIINPHATIGARCTLRQGVIIGTRRHDTDVPRIGDGVEFGAHAQALGNITIGDGAVVGAMTLVMIDVPPGATIVGVPGRLIRDA